MKQTILFLRNGNLYSTREEAIEGLNGVSHKIGQPVIALYGTTGSVELIFAIGTEEGEYKIIQEGLVSGLNIKTINDISILGSGNLEVGNIVAEDVAEPIEDFTSESVSFWNTLNAEINRAKAAEEALDEKIDNIPPATTEHDGLMSAEDKKALDTATSRALFVAAGAEYNDGITDKTKTAPWGETVIHKAKHYYLNGLGDITEEQMRSIYNASSLRENIHRPRFAHNIGVRTLLPIPGERGLFLKNIYFAYPLADYVFIETANAKKIFEVFALSNYSFDFITDNPTRVLPASATVANTFSGCKSLKAVCPIDMSTTINTTGLFSDCVALRYVYLSNLKTSLSFSDSPLIEKTCVLYTIVKASPSSSPITITLHSDAYARLAEDADILEALEAQPLITLVSA